MKKKLIETTITKRYKYGGGTMIHTVTKRKEFDPIYFSKGEANPEKWNVGGEFIDMAPKGNFITKFVKRIWNFRKLEQLLK